MSSYAAFSYHASAPFRRFRLSNMFIVRAAYPLRDIFAACTAIAGLQRTEHPAGSSTGTTLQRSIPPGTGGVAEVEKRRPVSSTTAIFVHESKQQRMRLGKKLDFFGLGLALIKRSLEADKNLW